MHNDDEIYRGARLPQPQRQTQAQDPNTILAQKWTPEVIALGYTAVPDLLLSRMAALGLTPTELVLLLQLLRYWWTFAHLPFPSKRKLAEAMGCSEKNVQKVMKRLEERGFVTRVERRNQRDSSHTNLYDLDPLVGKLIPFAAEEAMRRQQKAAQAAQRERVIAAHLAGVPGSASWPTPAPSADA
jgi:DNA replication protein DnaD